MGTFKLPQNSFTSGAINYEKLRGRTDIKQYFNAARRLHNVLVHPEGGVYRRDGTLFMHDYTTEAPTRLGVFEYSDDIKYLMVYYNNNIDVWEDNELEHTIETTGLTGSQITGFDEAQSANSLVIVHETFSPKELVRGATVENWTLSSLSFSFIPRWGFSVSVSQPAETLTPSGTSSIVTLTASGSVFASGDVGGYVSGNGGEARITKYVSGTVVEAFVVVPFVDTSAIASGAWDLENGYEAAWSGSKGYPRSVVYHDDRLGLGGTTSLPDVVWFSATADFLNFDTSRAFKNDAFYFILPADKVASVNYMVSEDNLLIFSSSGEYYVEGVLNAELDFRVKRQDKRGCRTNVKPVFVDGVSLFVERRANVLREMLFDDLQQKYRTNNLNLLSSTILNSPSRLVHLTPLGERAADNVYVVNGDGTWAVLNTLRAQDITAFTSGSSRSDLLLDAVDLDGVVYALFQRSIDGNDKIYLERFDPDAKMDCMSVYSGVATDTATAAHLEGETCGVIVNGSIHPDVVIDTAEATLEDEYTDISVGLKFTPSISLLPPIRELPDGTMLNRIRRVVAVHVGMKDTFGLSVNGRDVMFRRFGEDLFSSEPPTFSGVKRVGLLGYDSAPEVVIEQVEPLGFHITDVVMEVSV